MYVLAGRASAGGVGKAAMVNPTILGSAFDPEHLNAMSRAFDEACRKLGLADRNDAFAQVVAQQVVQCARAARDPDRICEMVLSELQEHPPSAA